MGSPLKASLVAGAGVFLAALLAALFHHNVINGRTMTLLQKLPMALFAAVLLSALAWLGTRLGLRAAGVKQTTSLTGVIVAAGYVAISFFANAVVVISPRTVTVPSREAGIAALEAVLIAAIWGMGAPFLISLLVGKLAARLSITK
jgi:hypothetical protein